MTDTYTLYSPDKSTVVYRNTTTADRNILDSILQYAIDHEADGIHHMVVDYDDDFNRVGSGQIMRWYGVIEFATSSNWNARSGHPCTTGRIEHVEPGSPHWPHPAQHRQERLERERAARQRGRSYINSLYSIEDGIEDPF